MTILALNAPSLFPGVDPTTATDDNGSTIAAAGARPESVESHALSTVAAEINAEHNLFCESLRRGLQHARRCGALLNAAKKQLDEHGQWLPWLREHCPDISIQVAQRYMRIHKRWAELEANTYFSTHLGLNEALGLLARPRTEKTDTVPSPSPGWVPLSELDTVDGSWHYDDPSRAAKLLVSVQRYGQLRPIVVGTSPDGKLTVVDGHGLLAAVRAAGQPEVWILDIGEIDTAAATDAMLALACGFELNYPVMADAVAKRLDAGGVTPNELARCAPVPVDRIEHFVQLSKWDWSLFAPKGERAREVGGDEFPIIDPDNLKIDYECPHCGYEWSGNPKPRQGGE